ALAASGAAADVTLALSIAGWRAAAAQAGEALHRRVAAAAGTTPAMPHPLVNVFSGGVHAAPRPDSFQQLMAVPCRATFAADAEAALAVWAEAERRLAGRGAAWTLSASSGMLVEGATSEELLAELHAVVSPHERVGTGADVAAEHLAAGPGLYRLDGRTLAGPELLDLLDRLCAERELVFLEDPFAPEDEELWRELTERLAGRTAVVGDDLFATDAARMDRALATAVLLKPSQAGTVAATLDAARAALDAGIDLCVSHRSGETEDTFVCDLAVGLGALAQKVGGPRRGDRIAKYNQLLRLAEEGGLAPSAAAVAPGRRPLTAVEDT
ncbi:MAG TPA: phosphopyruvate hydratase, partial [Solirubrobacteraceae bacterium]|nr:phosphopyruvate hydratase [Solirubrobacteraceae bacterium]